MLLSNYSSNISKLTSTSEKKYITQERFILNFSTVISLAPDSSDGFLWIRRRGFQLNMDEYLRDEADF